MQGRGNSADGGGTPRQIVSKKQQDGNKINILK